MGQECAGARHLICLVTHVCDLIVCSLSLFLTLFPSVFFSYLFFYYLNLDLYLFVHADVIGAISYWHSANCGVWPVGRKCPSHSFMSPTSLTISTTRRLLRSSSRGNPATRCPRTCLARNSATRPSAERSLHHFSFRSEKNQRTEDKLITLLKKVCCHLSPCLSVMQQRGDPCMNLVR